MGIPANTPVWQIILFYVLIIWGYIWKGIALWKASGHHQRNWFIVILILNTFGIVEIIYLFRFAKKRMTLKEIRDWFTDTFTTTKTKS